ncbi:MAG: aminopeptidase P family N-terminal domain-containing protein [Betaproteobacteria bacterium]|nr:aminopeptidase P family N-terminal domain-containing protein [Betaproteobacteria bacterium]
MNWNWLVMFHPVSIHWLTGSDGKAYQEFQCLLLSALPGPLVILTREGERNEYLDDVLVDEIFTFGGGENEDAVAAFEKIADSLGLRSARVGMEVPAYYLHPHDYIRLRQFFGNALVAEPTNLVHDLKLVKSPAELAYIREAARKADAAMAAFAAESRRLKAGTKLKKPGPAVHATLLEADSVAAAKLIGAISGRRRRLESWRA